MHLAAVYELEDGTGEPVFGTPRSGRGPRAAGLSGVAVVGKNVEIVEEVLQAVVGAISPAPMPTSTRRSSSTRNSAIAGGRVYRGEAGRKYNGTLFGQFRVDPVRDKERLVDGISSSRRSKKMQHAVPKVVVTRSRQIRYMRSGRSRWFAREAQVLLEQEMALKPPGCRVGRFYFPLTVRRWAVAVVAGADHIRKCMG